MEEEKRRTSFRYKDHVKVDEKSRIITNYAVTDMNIYDSQQTEPLVNGSDKGKSLHADSAYTGEPIVEALEEKDVGNRIHERAYRNKPFPDKQKERNRGKSKVPARIEHVFGFIEKNLCGSRIIIGSIGKK